MLRYPYQEKILGIKPGNRIAYWPLFSSVGTTAYERTGVSGNGTHSSVTLGNAVAPGGGNAALYDGVNDYTDIYTANFESNFNGDKGTLFGWCKVSGVGVWTDGTARYVVRFFAGSTNNFEVVKSGGNNRIDVVRDAGGTSIPQPITSFSVTDWFSFMMTWDTGADEQKFYINGALDETDSGLGSFSGPFDTSRVLIGAGTKTGTGVWDGWISHVAVWDDVLSLTEYLELDKAA